MSPKKKKKKAPSQKSPARGPKTRRSPLEQGKSAFSSGHMNVAIQHWSLIEPRSDAVEEAIEEALFRQGTTEPDAGKQIDLFRQALKLRPDDHRCLKHLAFAFHRQGQLEEAQRLYEQTQRHQEQHQEQHQERSPTPEEKELFERAAALAAVEANPTDESTLATVIAQHPVFSPLTTLLAEQPPDISLANAREDSEDSKDSEDSVDEWCAAVNKHLFGDDELATTLPTTDDSAKSKSATKSKKQRKIAIADGGKHLWTGMMLLKMGKIAHSRDELSRLAPAIRQTASPLLISTHSYYLGLSYALLDDYQAALETWVPSSHSLTYHPWWLDTIAAVATHYLYELLEAGEVAKAADISLQLLETPLNAGPLHHLQVTALDRLAEEMARNGNWQQAIDLWERARELVSQKSMLGSPRPLVHNLAIAYEQEEQWEEAAEAWRTLLRTRPRRRKKNGEAVTDSYGEEGWAWVRQRVVHCYKHAGMPERAVSLFRQAIKQHPKDIDMRMQLVDALIANDQEQAASNEIDRILAMDENHPEALIRQAAIFQLRGQLQQAEKSLRRVYEHHPDREDIRLAIIQSIRERGERFRVAGISIFAKEVFQEGEAFAPEDPQFPLLLGQIAFQNRNHEEAKQYLNRALGLAGENISIYVQIAQAWLIAEEYDLMREVLDKGAEHVPIKSDLMLNIGLTAFRTKRFFHIMSKSGRAEKNSERDARWDEIGKEYIEKAVELEQRDIHYIADLVIDLFPMAHIDVVLPYAREMWERMKDDPQASLIYGFALALHGNIKQGKQVLSHGKQIALQQDDPSFAKLLEQVRQKLNDPNFTPTVDILFSILGVEDNYL